MRKFDVTLDFTGAKINAIKAIRSATGLSLKDAKDASEFLGVSSTGTTLRMSGEQTAMLLHHVREEQARIEQTYGYDPAMTPRRLNVERVLQHEARRSTPRSRSRR